ncbi:Phospholipid ABC transporter substrate-binding protein MlaD [hydrothermal vent metagenome]|uniref:Phospholipid ABC transporter substrate-binding protein MlaD n=1 Tax=hydrothermal vent metagenome TaxID=652676 RepID=A0A3B0XTS1_9ZZZZ
MKTGKTTELMVGMFIVVGAAALLVLAMQVSNLSNFAPGNSYTVTARFENVGGLKTRSPVTIGGVRIGRVASIDFDNTRFEAVVVLEIDGKYDQFPEDSTASIYTAGLLGEQYVSLEPGGSDELLTQGSEIDLTQSALVLEKLISKFLFEKTTE